MTPTTATARETLAQLRLERIAQLDCEIEAKREAMRINHQDGELVSRTIESNAEWRRAMRRVDETEERLFSELVDLQRRRDAILAAQEAL